MPNTGKLLEAFVEQIEKILLPEGIAVTANERICNDEGVQIAEFDIKIEGKVGTTKLKWLIECRDRPAQGPAPGAWIEQLVGRRDRFGFNKVIAVSTTGFADTAKQYAEVAGIEIRTVTETDVDQIKDWFLTDKITLFQRGGRLDHATLLIAEDEPEEIRESLRQTLIRRGPNEPFLLSTETAEHTTVTAAFQSAINSIGGRYDELMPEGGSRNVRLRAAYPQDDSHYVIEIPVGKVRITEILFQGEIFVTKKEVPIAAVKQYTNISSGEDIATTTSFTFEVDGKGLEVSFHKIAETGATHVQLGASKKA